MALYKTGKFLQASVARVAFKILKQEKPIVQLLHERILNQAKGTTLLET